MARVTQIPITVDFPTNAPPCCCGQPSGVCCCDDLPDTLYVRIVVTGWVTCSPPVNDQQEIFFAITRGECETIFEAGPFEKPLGDCVSGVHCGEFTSKQCTIGGVLFDSLNQVILQCVKTSAEGNEMGFVMWRRQEQAPGSFLPWGYVGSGAKPCPITVIDDWEGLVGSWVDLEVRMRPF